MKERVLKKVDALWQQQPEWVQEAVINTAAPLIFIFGGAYLLAYAVLLPKRVSTPLGPQFELRDHTWTLAVVAAICAISWIPVMFFLYVMALGQGANMATEMRDEVKEFVSGES